MGRIPQLDILRAIAVLMVIAYHYTPTPTSRGGWVGVDLFFVLSGFLISGLLFNEVQRTGSLSIKRFLIRRGFKIYPAFYFFLATGWAMDPLRLIHGYTNEILFLQNYLSRVWGHTWSLAVEEHFYLVLPFVMLLLSRLNRLRAIPPISAALLIACLAMRALVARQVQDFHASTYPTHLRIDSLFFGVSLAYVYRFRGEIWRKLSHWWLLPVGVALFLPSMLLDRDDMFALTGALTLNSIGAGCVLIWTIENPWLHAKSVEQIGQHSYSIYLWQALIIPFCTSKSLSLVNLVFCICMCIAIGITFAVIIEMPALALRDRLFASQQKDKKYRPPSVHTTHAGALPSDAGH